LENLNEKQVSNQVEKRDISYEITQMIKFIEHIHWRIW